MKIQTLQALSWAIRSKINYIKYILKMKKLIIVLLTSLLSVYGFSQTAKFGGSGGGGLQPADTLTFLASHFMLSSAVGMSYPGAGIPFSTGSAWGTSITNNSTDWNTAYTDRLKWDGGSTGLVAATGRTSLGGTTIGQAFFTLSNPGVIHFYRGNADNTLTAQSAADFKTSLSLNNVTNESKATMFTNPTFIGTPVIATPFTLGATSVTSDGTELNVLDGIPGTLTATELGYVDGVTSAIQTQLGGKAATTLGNLASVAINTTLLPASNDGAALGNTTYKFSDLWLANGGVIDFNSGDVTLTQSSNLLTLGGGGLTISGAYSIAMTGSIGSTGSRVTKIWAANLEVTNSPTVNGTSIASIYAPIASPIFTGTPKITASDTVSTKAYARSVGGATGKLNLADSVDYTNGYMSRFDGVTGDAGKLNKADSGVYNGGYVSPTDLDEALAAFSLDDTVALEKIVTLQSDTVPLFVFGGGGGNAGDTTSFTTSTIYGSYRVKDTTIITSINAVMVAGTTPLGTDTLGIQIYFNDSINVTTGGSVRLLNSATLGINSVTTGTVDASFANNTIYPGERVFMKSPGVITGRKPIYVEVTVYGHIINRSY